MVGNKGGKRTGPQRTLDALIIMDVVGLAALGLATNISTGLLSDEKAWPWAHNPYIMWPTVVILVIALVTLALLRRKVDSKQESDETASDSFHANDITDSTVIAGSNSGTVVTAPSSTFIGTVEKLTFDTLSSTIRNPAPNSQTEESINNLQPRNASFTGRRQQLDDVSTLLDRGPVAVVAMHGLGGIGKSTLALHYAHERLADGTYRIVWWIHAEDQITLLEDLSSLAPKLGLATEKDQNDTAAAVVTVLNQRSDWLLVFDNATNPDYLRPHLPSSGKGHVLITSRGRGWTGLAKPIELEVFSREDATDFIRARTGKDDSDSIARLVEELGYLPLALAQAAAYIEIHDMSIKAYLKAIEDHQEAAKLLTQGLPTSEYPKSVAATWLLHFADLERNNPAALDLLRLCAFVAPDDIPVNELLSHPDQLPQQLARATSTATGLAETVGALTKTHLAGKSDDPGETLNIHRLVQAVTRHQLEDDEKRFWADCAASRIVSLLPEEPEQPRSWPQSARLAAHARTAAEHTTNAQRASKLLFWLGEYSFARVELTVAREYLQRALTVEENAYGPNHPASASALANLGLVHLRLGELAAARDLQQRALTIFEKELGADHTEVALTLGNLGNTLNQLGEPTTASEYLQRALDMQERAYGPNHPEVASTLTNLAIAQQDLGEPTTARKNLQRALTIFEKVYGPNHAEVARTLINLGNTLNQLGEPTTASEYLQRALDMQERAYGPNHPEVATALADLGLVYQRLRELTTARDLQQRALTIEEDAYGPDHPQVARTLGNLGNTLSQLEEHTLAREYLQRALTIEKRVYGPDHPQVARTLGNLGGIHGELGKFTTAGEYFLRALSIFEHAYGPDHPEVARTLGNLGIVHRELGDLTTALAYLQRALTIEEHATDATAHEERPHDS